MSICPTCRGWIDEDERGHSIVEIQALVCEHFGLSLLELKSARQAQYCMRPRQIAMYLCHRETVRNYSEIGRFFGPRDRTTIMHGVRAIEKLIGEDLTIRRAVETLQKALKQAGPIGNQQRLDEEAGRGETFRDELLYAAGIR